MIAHGILADYTNEYLSIGENTTLECVRIFAKVLICVFGLVCLRDPNEEDTKRLITINEQRVWMVMLVSIDCMY
jgi:hypothetical protein